MARIISAGKQLPSLKKKWAIPTSMCIHSPEARKRIVSCAISNKPNLSDSAELVDTEASGKVFLLHMEKSRCRLFGDSPRHFLGNERRRVVEFIGDFTAYMDKGGAKDGI